MDDRYFMEMALELAVKGRGFTSPNPMVGAVVVKDDRIIGSGYHEGAGKPHAEVNAINDAGSSAKGSTIYVTLEPCNHTGRTPPCSGKILEAGIQRVVTAMKDPNPDVRGGGNDFLKSRGIKVECGLCEDEAKKINEVYEKYITTKRPFVTVKCAATLDGSIATRTGDSRWVSGEESREFVHRLRHANDAIMVGIGTVKSDDPRLTTRLEGADMLDPIRVVLDTGFSISENASMLNLDSDSDTIVVTGNSIAQDKKTRVEAKGTRVVNLPSSDGYLAMESVMEYLGESGITSVLVEGGSRIIASVIKAGVVDKILFFYAPKILGGDDGVPICRGPGPALMSECVSVKNVNVLRFGDDVLIEGYI